MSDVKHKWKLRVLLLTGMMEHIYCMETVIEKGPREGFALEFPVKE